MLLLLKQKSYNVTFMIDGEERLMPTKADSVFQIKSEHSPTFETMANFLQDLSYELAKTVVVTPENTP